MALDRIFDKMGVSFMNYISKKRDEMNLYGAKMSSLNPFAIFDRGYSIAQKNGQIVSSVDNVVDGDRLEINLKDGVLGCQVSDINKI